jgi:hypothetical protein
VNENCLFYTYFKFGLAIVSTEVVYYSFVRYMFIVASGFVLGEGVLSIFTALLKNPGIIICSLIVLLQFYSHFVDFRCVLYFTFILSLFFELISLLYFVHC